MNIQQLRIGDRFTLPDGRTFTAIAYPKTPNPAGYVAVPVRERMRPILEHQDTQVKLT